MTIIPSHTRLRSLYNKYLFLDEKAYYDKIRFYEQNELDVYNMCLEDSLWIQSGYLEAVYKISDYKKYCDKSQDLLERLIFHNISIFQGEDLYQDTLHMRAASFYHLKKYNDSIHTAEQLLKIDSLRNNTAKILFYAHRSSFKKTLKFIKAGLMAALLSTAAVLLFEQIVIASFFPEMITMFLKLIAYIFMPIFTILIGAKIAIDVISLNKTNRWIKKCKKH